LTFVGCDDLYKHSVISWCDYIDHEPDTTFAFGFKSLISVYRKLLKTVRNYAKSGFG
jgi:hypothetical protein